MAGPGRAGSARFPRPGTPRRVWRAAALLRRRSTSTPTTAFSARSTALCLGKVLMSIGLAIGGNGRATACSSVRPARSSPISPPHHPARSTTRSPNAVPPTVAPSCTISARTRSVVTADPPRHHREPYAGPGLAHGGRHGEISCVFYRDRRVRRRSRHPRYEFLDPVAVNHDIPASCPTCAHLPARTPRLRGSLFGALARSRLVRAYEVMPFCIRKAGNRAVIRGHAMQARSGRFRVTHVGPPAHRSSPWRPSCPLSPLTAREIRPHRARCDLPPIPTAPNLTRSWPRAAFQPVAGIRPGRRSYDTIATASDHSPNASIDAFTRRVGRLPRLGRHTEHRVLDNSTGSGTAEPLPICRPSFRFCPAKTPARTCAAPPSCIFDPRCPLLSAARRS